MGGFLPVSHDALALASDDLEAFAVFDLYRRGHRVRWRSFRLTEEVMCEAWGMGNRRVWALLEGLQEAGLIRFERGSRRVPTKMEVLSPTSDGVQDSDQQGDPDNSLPPTPESDERAGRRAGQDAAPFPTRAVRLETETQDQDLKPLETRGERVPTLETAPAPEPAPPPLPPSDPDPKPAAPRGPRPSGPLSSAWASAWLTEHGAVYAFATTDADHLRAWASIVGEDVALFAEAIADFHAAVRQGKAWKGHPTPPAIREFSADAQRWVNAAATKRARTAAQQVTAAAKARMPQGDPTRPQAHHEALEVWRGVLEQLQGHLPHDTIQVTIAKLAVPVAVDADALVVAYPEGWAAMVEPYAEDLQDALGEPGKGGRALRLVVDAEVSARAREGPRAAAK